MNWKLNFFISHLLLIGLKPDLDAQIDLFGCRLQLQGLTVYRDTGNDARFYYLPDSFFIVSDKDNIAYEEFIRYVFDVKRDEKIKEGGGVYQALLEYGLSPDRIGILNNHLRKTVPEGNLAGSVPALKILIRTETGVGFISELPLKLLSHDKAVVLVHLNRNEVKILEPGFLGQKYSILSKPSVVYSFEAHMSFSARLPWDSIQPALLRGDSLSIEKIKNWLGKKIIRLKNLQGDEVELYSWESEPVAGLLKETICQREHYFPPLDSSGGWTFEVKNEPVLINLRVDPDYIQTRQPFKRRFEFLSYNLQSPFRSRELFFVPEEKLLDMMRDNSLDFNVDYRVRIKFRQKEFFVFEKRIKELSEPTVVYPNKLSIDFLNYENQVLYQLKKEEDSKWEAPVARKTIWQPSDHQAHVAHSIPGFTSTLVDVIFEPQNVQNLIVHGVKVEFFAGQGKNFSALKKIFLLPILDSSKGITTEKQVQFFLPEENSGLYYYKITWFLQSGEVIESELLKSTYQVIFVDEIKT